ncbi:helix-turn-helix domain-containing protein [Robertmurraya kyonggiensis]|uniref:Helix-turn-helix domain-containing protein n=1 Tax=Robertmurraya kyonggiensis TaxID=1037680 RepID=A0A4U1DBY9_9BACI|nr:helix-turn-helix domain-containing protein [Robertmurraya kyonggiensis]TKC19593.1 helix-turn-helix domain-containing protein [Robertmurraya kyonggiensis]
MVGERIKQLRTKKGYSISELAKIAGVSKSYLSYIERNVQRNPSLQFLTKIAETLETSMEYLLEEEIQLDEEWISLIKKAINDGVSKEDFQKYLDFVKFKKWEEDQHDPSIRL